MTWVCFYGTTLFTTSSVPNKSRWNNQIKMAKVLYLGTYIIGLISEELNLDLDAELSAPWFSF